MPSKEQVNRHRRGIVILVLLISSCLTYREGSIVMIEEQQVQILDLPN